MILPMQTGKAKATKHFLHSSAVLTFIGLAALLVSCKQIPDPEIQEMVSSVKKHYVSMDGLWRATPETTIKYPNGTLEPLLQIRRDARGQVIVQGCFIWDGRFYEYWPISDVRFNDSTRQLRIDYNEESTYIGRVGPQLDFIRGTACGGDPSDTARLDFIREESLDINRLFVPLPPGPDGSITYSYAQPADGKDQLLTASIFDFVKDSAVFYKLIDRVIQQEFGRLESLLILKDRKLILEEYFYAYDRTQLHHIHSCTKSVTSLLMGIALERHQIQDVDQPVLDFFPQFDSLRKTEMAGLTLEHVLTMTTGFGEGDDIEVDHPFDQAKYFLSLPLESVPGEKFEYDNRCTDLLGDIIYSLENKQADEFAREVLFNKLDISEFIWERENDVLHCYSDLYLKPRDMAKIGLLVLQNGSWNGEQIVPEDWVAESSKPHVAESEYFDYGYQWWCRSKNNKSWWDDPVHGSMDELNMFHARGFGGQYIMVIRDLDMVIVVTASDYNEENGMANQKVRMVIEEIVPIIN